MEIKSCTNAFCQNKGFYLKDVVIYDDEQVKLDDFLIVLSQDIQAGRNILILLPG